MLINILIKIGVLMLFTRMLNMNMDGVPLLLALIYGIMSIIFGLFHFNNFLLLFFNAGVVFVLVLIYFKLLEKYYGAGLIYWVILVGGLAIGLI